MLSSIVALALAVAAPARSAADVPLPPGELRGQVLGAKGLPVARFTVNGVRFEDPEGRFKVLTPPEGEFRVVVRADGFAPNVFHVQGVESLLELLYRPVYSHRQDGCAYGLPDFFPTDCLQREYIIPRRRDRS